MVSFYSHDSAHSHDRGSLADRAAELLAAGASHEAALLAALRRAVPGFADWCVVDYYTAERELRAVHSGYPDARKEALMLDIRRRYRAERGENGDVLAALESGEALLYPDMTEIASVRLDPGEMELLADLGLRSSIVVPMHVDGQPLGVVSFVSMRRHYDDADVETAREFAVGCTRVLTRGRDENEINRSLAVLDAVYGAAPVALGFVDRELRLTRVNDHLAALSGLPGGTHTGRAPADVLGELGQQLTEFCRRVLADERPVVDIELTAATTAEGMARHWRLSLAPVALDGRALGISCVVQDNTARKRSETRAAFLVHVGEILDSSLDYRQTLQRVARLAVPDIADWCSISMLDDRGEMYRLAVAHADSVKDELGQELIEREALPMDAPAGAASVMQTAQTQVVSHFSDEMLVRSLGDTRSQEIVRALGLASSVSVPLVARGRTLGAISLLSAIPDRFDAEDVSLAEELARRAAVSIDNARLYTEHRRIAHTLQAGLLPRALPEIPGLDLAVRYRPAGELNEVGGDFYDAYLRAAGEWLVVIGDVTGKGANAAATTALIRYTLRAAALRPGSARDLLLELNRAMLAQDASMCTVALLSIHPTASGTPELSVCLAGHPEPLLLGADGTVAAVGTQGTLLGYVDDPRLTDTAVELRHGDTLVLHTDGLTEATRPGWTKAELHERLTAAPTEGLPDLLEYLETMAVTTTEHAPRDDIALLALRTVGSAG